jgi:hypothetical protein
MTRSRTATPVPAPTFLVTDRLTHTPGRQASGIGDALDDGLTALSLRIGAAVADKGAESAVLLIDAYAAARLGLPVDPAAIEGDAAAAHPAVADLQAAGWRVKRLRPWTTLYPVERGSRPTLHVGILPWLNRSDCPLIGYTGRTPAETFDLAPADIVDAFGLWARLVGTPYNGTPGSAGTTAVRAFATAGKGERKPTWEPRELGPEGAYEVPYQLPTREGDRPTFNRGLDEIPEDHAWLHGYDAKRAYLAAFNSTYVCPWTLRNTGAKTEYSGKLAGWWLVEVEPWEPGKYGHAGWESNCLPDPAGYPRAFDEPGPKWAADTGRTVRWVTGPTMQLLTDLREEGLHEGYTIHDSWTGPAHRVLRPVYERFRSAWLAPETQPDPARPDYRTLTALQAGFKDLYRKTWGMLDYEYSQVRRPDWHHAVLAGFRANLWRRLRAVGEESGRWPVSIDTDNVYYSSAEEDPMKAVPAGLPLGDGLGTFAYKRSKRIR